MSDQQQSRAAEQLRFLADQIDAGKVQKIDVHYDWQPSSDEPMSPMESVFRITVTMPPDLAALGYEVAPTIDEVPHPVNEVVQGMAQVVISERPHVGNRWSPNPEEWPAQMRRDWARWQPNAERWRQQ